MKQGKKKEYKKSNRPKKTAFITFTLSFLIIYKLLEISTNTSRGKSSALTDKSYPYLDKTFEILSKSYPSKLFLIVFLLNLKLSRTNL